MLKHHERNNLEISKSESCNILFFLFLYGVEMQLRKNGKRTNDNGKHKKWNRKHKKWKLVSQSHTTFVLWFLLRVAHLRWSSQCSYARSFHIFLGLIGPGAFSLPHGFGVHGVVFRGFFHFDSKRCKGVHCVDLGESFPTTIYLQKLALIQPRALRSTTNEHCFVNNALLVLTTAYSHV